MSKDRIPRNWRDAWKDARMLSRSLGSIPSWNTNLVVHDDVWTHPDRFTHSWGKTIFDDQSRFQQRRTVTEKEQKLVEKYEASQAKVLERLGTKTPGSVPIPPGKVRQMFEERRTKPGIDKSYPLQPLTAPNPRPVPTRFSNGNTPKTQSVIQEVKQYTEPNGDTYATLKIQKIIKSTRDINLNEDTVDRGFIDHDPITTNKLPNVGGAFPSQRSIKRETNNNPSNGKIKVPEPKVNRVPDKKPAPAKTPSKTSSIRKSPSIPEPVPTPEKMKAATPKTFRPTKPTGMDQKSQVQIPSATSPVGDACKYCSRHFASDRIEKHEAICSKTGRKKRKPYDAVKHRVAMDSDWRPSTRHTGTNGTEVESYVKKSAKTPTKPQPGRVSTPPKKESNWRKKHEEFITAIREAKKVQAHIKSGGKLSDLPPPPPSENADYVACPHCNRRFNASAAERHIPKCANYQFNKPKPAIRKR